MENICEEVSLTEGCLACDLKSRRWFEQRNFRTAGRRDMYGGAVIRNGDGTKDVLKALKELTHSLLN